MTTQFHSIQTSTPDLVINFHMTESCNYQCGYCYATWEDLEAKQELHRLSVKESSQVDLLLAKLADYFLSDNSLKETMGYQHVRLNFAGGEPMLLGPRLLEAVKLAKKLGFKTSLITNGHYLTDDVLSEIASSLSVLGISYDTANKELAEKIGRVDRKQRWVTPKQLVQLCSLYRSLNPTGFLKFNTVVNSINCHDDLFNLIQEIQPNKWKLLRVLPVHDHQLMISQLAYQSYVQRHSSLSNIIVEEDNDVMTHSYLMINPEGRFYQNSDAGGGYILSDPILSVGVQKALDQVPFDVVSFKQRYPFIPSITIEEDAKSVVKGIELNECDVIPNYIKHKAWKEIERLVSNEDKGRQWKKICSCEGFIRFKLNYDYRLVVAKGHIQTGPYECMKHSTFDKRFK